MSSSTRRRVLVSYLALAAVLVSTVANAFLPLATPAAPAWAVSASLLIDADDYDERSLLPGAFLSRDGQPQRLSRADARDTPDNGAVPPAIAATIGPAAPVCIDVADVHSIDPASPRTSYRPRDPPVTA